MSSSTSIDCPKAVNVDVTDETLTVVLADGRTLSVPTAWFPRLQRGRPEDRNTWEAIGAGVGIHWPALDEDISVAGLLKGHRSNESARSLAQWESWYDGKSRRIPAP